MLILTKLLKLGEKGIECLKRNDWVITFLDIVAENYVRETYLTTENALKDVQSGSSSQYQPRSSSKNKFYKLLLKL